MNFREVPLMLRRRLLSVRSFSAAGMMVDADVTEGSELETLLERLLDDSATAYVHIHTARHGCFLAGATRA